MELAIECSQQLAGTDVRKLQAAIERLPPGRLASLRAWFRELDADAWDGELIEDIRSGRLDEAAAAALRAHRRGESSRL